MVWLTFYLELQSIRYVRKFTVVYYKFFWTLLFQTIEIFDKSKQIHSYLCICLSQVNEPTSETLHPSLACLHVLCLVYLLLFKSAASFASFTNLGFKTNVLKKYFTRRSEFLAILACGLSVNIIKQDIRKVSLCWCYLKHRQDLPFLNSWMRKNYYKVIIYSKISKHRKEQKK